MPRMDFSKFNGDDPRSWLRKCRKYFLMSPMNDCERVVLAGMYMEGSAEHWYLDNIEGREVMAGRSLLSCY